MEITWNLTQGSFKGTFEEFAALSERYPNLAGVMSYGVESTPEASQEVVDAPAEKPVKRRRIIRGVLRGPPKEAFQALIHRRPLAPSHEKVLRAVVDAGRTGITSSELAKTLGIESKALKSAMRLLGKRAKYTNGWPGAYEVFYRTWLGSENRYVAWPQMAVVLNEAEP